MLDIDHGTYPYVTSSNCVASAVFSGVGIGPGNLEAVLGISKGYTTRVGAGPFPSEFTGYLADSLREEGDEFGSATGRPRRIGWFDAVLARYTARVNGMWALALTKLDVLTGIDPVKICVGYIVKGKRYDDMPPSHRMLINAKPVYEEMPGWSESPAGARTLDELPSSVRRYVEQNQRTGWRADRDDRRRQGARSHYRAQQSVRRLARFFTLQEIDEFVDGHFRLRIKLRRRPGPSSRCSGTVRTTTAPDLVIVTWLPFWEARDQPERSKARIASAPRTDQCKLAINAKPRSQLAEAFISTSATSICVGIPF